MLHRRFTIVRGSFGPHINSLELGQPGRGGRIIKHRVEYRCGIDNTDLEAGTGQGVCSIQINFPEFARKPDGILINFVGFIEFVGRIQKT